MRFAEPRAQAGQDDALAAVLARQGEVITGKVGV